ncbi:hypothetical protein SAY86_017091 [Trapa natans]|uniref:Uncharacterized protein n=1 Tax=Trapa natans TaxID=22666 RepID=A0AAN7M0Y3_TRANT|nr:hypothetical protein SAY86_017091 [Trapa natans]
MVRRRWWVLKLLGSCYLRASLMGIHGWKSNDDGETTTRPAFRSIPRAVRSGPQPPEVASDDDAVLRSVSFGGDLSAEEVGGGSHPCANHAVRIRFHAARDLPVHDAMWVRDFLHRVHADALGSWVSDVSVRRRNRLCSFHVRAVHSLLCHRSTTTEPAEEDFL